MVEAEILKNVVLHSVATALARRVFPVPYMADIQTVINNKGNRQIDSNDRQLYNHTMINSSDNNKLYNQTIINNVRSLHNQIRINSNEEALHNQTRIKNNDK